MLPHTHFEPPRPWQTADKRATPRRVERLIGEHVVTVACGWRHTAALTMQGALYSWGHGGFGQLGHGGTIDFYLPLRVKGGELWQQVACGWRHTGALARGGVAHTWGDGDQLQLGHGDAKMRVSPTAVDALFEVSLQQLSIRSSELLCSRHTAFPPPAHTPPSSLPFHRCRCCS